MRFVKKQLEHREQIPGELVFIGDQKQDFTRIRLIAYNQNEVIEQTIEDFSEIEKFETGYDVIWINIDGVHDKELISKVGKKFGIHSLILEDIMHTGHHPKMQVDEQMLFTIFKMLALDEEKHQVDSEQFSLYLKGKYILTFQEKVGDVFEPVRERIRNKKGRIRRKGSDYLCFCLLDSLADNYAVIMEYFGGKVEDLEEIILKDPKARILAMLSAYQIELNLLRKVVRPTKDMLLKFNKSKSDLLDEGTYAYMDDLGDTIMRVHENMDTLKLMLSDQLNIYSTHVNHKLNDVMKVLTIFSAIFIPLTFIAGIYGTNFDYLPELKFKYSYFVMLGIMIVLVVGMLIFFKRKRWL